jgi:hypothetical protein
MKIHIWKPRLCKIYSLHTLTRVVCKFFSKQFLKFIYRSNVIQISSMEHTSPDQQNHINFIMRCIQKTFVNQCLVAVVNEENLSDFRTLVAAVTRKLEELGCTFSEDLIRELITEIVDEIGDEEE